MPLNTSPKNILLAPLDWGLGHTTRCIPLARFLLAAGCTVTAAGTDAQTGLLAAACPGVRTIFLEGYGIKYARQGRYFAARLLAQVPRILHSIKKERSWLAQYAAAHCIDGVISDNRYGFYHPEIPSVILTHQLFIRTGFGAFADAVLRRLHYKKLRPFDNCWVVDVARDGSEGFGPADRFAGLAGTLSHPAKLPRNAAYVGLLSQFENSTALPRKDVILILLSGPEPQRSLLSELLWRQALDSKRRFVFVEGRKGIHRQTPTHILHYDILTADDAAPLMSRAALVICRAGYSTLMDLAATRTKAIVIPTPGQTEQEYLGKSLHRSGVFFSAKQEGFSLAESLAQSQSFPFAEAARESNFQEYRAVLRQWLDSL